MPDFSFEMQVKGAVCGLDEVGRAPLVGPVTAACVYIPEQYKSADIWALVNDSKKTPKKKREAFAEQIKTHSIWGIAEASAREVEDINIVQASFLAMRRAYETVANKAGFHFKCALIDGHLSPPFPCPVQTIIKGDSKSVSIAAASIIAKVDRDALLAKLSQTYPHYGWERNAGYPTREHLNAININGVTAHHRRNFAPIRNYLLYGQVDPQTKMAV